MRAPSRCASEPAVARARAERVAALRFGRLAEAACRWRLRLAGWRILARDWRTPVGEIDIIARRGRMIAFVEVKARADIAAETAPPAPRQRRRIARAAHLFLQRRPDLAGLEVRFDVMLIAPGRRPRHVPGAWRADEGGAPV